MEKTQVEAAAYVNSTLRNDSLWLWEIGPK